MIDNTGRYAGGIVGNVYDKRSTSASTYVYRKFDVPFDISYAEHRFREGDRLDVIAAKLYGDPKLWAKIMDINPEIADPFYIKPGTVVRIPVD